MRLPIRQIAAFAEAPFRGNPAAVVQVEDWPPSRLMQAIASENNQTTTVYLRRGGVFRCTLRPDGCIEPAGRCAFYLRGEITV